MHDFTAALVAAHRGSADTVYPADTLPADFAHAMRIQRDVAQAMGASVAGWKVGFAADGTPVAGPLLDSVLVASPAALSLPARGYIVEIELAFRLTRDLPVRAYTREEILDACGEALIGIELIRGRFGEPPAVPYAAFLADNLGNAGYVTGDAVSPFRSLDLRSLRCRFEVDGKLVQEGSGGHPQGDPVEPLRAYASVQGDRLGGMKAGQVITTGSLTTPLRIEHAARIAASLEGIGRVALQLLR